MLSLGLMSGTSMDGIDAAVIDTDGSAVITELGHLSIPYDPSFKILLKAAEFAVKKNSGDLTKSEETFPTLLHTYLKNELSIPETIITKKIKQLAQYLHHQEEQTITLTDIIKHSTDLHANAVKQLLNSISQPIDVVGYHGQTLFHRPNIGITLQVGDGQQLANQLQTIVVNDFRSQDVAAGGQGAPFAPLYHQALATRDNKIPLAVVNCGGIANVTLINSTDETELLGWDTGPGNALIDSYIRLRTHGDASMDTDGNYAKRGAVQPALLRALYEKSILKNGNNYFQMLPPKSLDYGDITLIPELTDKNISIQDACRTLAAFTADSIVNSLALVNTPIPKQWVLAGGGWNNPVIRSEFETRLKQKYGKDLSIQTADEIQWNNQAIEAQTFAYLAVRCLQNQPISFPNITGIAKPLCGGQIHRPKMAQSTANHLYT